MHISTRGRYGTRAMVTLAGHYQDGFVAASKIAEEQDVSQKYLEKLLVILKKAGLVTSTKGVTGGYRLAKPPQKISLQEILESLGESFDIVFCTAAEDLCGRRPGCPTRPVWLEIRETVTGILSCKTLADLHGTG